MKPKDRLAKSKRLVNNEAASWGGDELAVSGSTGGDRSSDGSPTPQGAAPLLGKGAGSRSLPEAPVGGGGGTAGGVVGLNLSPETKVTTRLETWTQDMCGKYALVAECEYGHEWAKVLDCGREWCPKCGVPMSDVHLQRVARWLPKAQTMLPMGYLVITIPPSKRGLLHSADGLRWFRRSVVRSLKYLGFDRGLSRWHYFGDKHVGKFHPHLNILIPCGQVQKATLQRLKGIIRGKLGCDVVVVRYRYSKKRGKMMHWLRYVTKASFRVWQWDAELADGLYRFNNTHCWGNWDGLPQQWSLPPNNELDAVSKLEMRICPKCGQELTWLEDGFNKTEDLLQIGFVWAYAGWLFRDIPPPDV